MKSLVSGLFRVNPKKTAYHSVMGITDARDYVIGDDVEVDDVDLGQEAVYVNGVRLTNERVEQMAAESVALARSREAKA
ncbi:hypothetical protein MPRI_00970 [Mycobacterium paraintracellulare]|uniref:Uncharacterized protein n=1 Tax=Mycobacterium paraintracellulare TaxID=1138383 RepID=A0ABN6AFR3_9MYCO|nr:hypothetical protein OCQ_34820 [Mycobacterium paraintracellulare]OSC22168.1 hypothetical protein B8W68_22530 [Mycobacterium paraintracellulare]BBY67910.1 hypothetical protein MPRI_00970 [Mycobacterium paraintracellulare]BCP16437.1 hypothetical protein MINTM021_33460 [Mycobacterium paraintracellulare]